MMDKIRAFFARLKAWFVGIKDKIEDGVEKAKDRLDKNDEQEAESKDSAQIISVDVGQEEVEPVMKTKAAVKKTTAKPKTTRKPRKKTP